MPLLDRLGPKPEPELAVPDPDDDSAQLDLAFGSPPAPRDYAEDESDALFPLNFAASP